MTEKEQQNPSKVSGKVVAECRTRMERKRQRHSRAVLVPCPFQGHINPMLQLGTILHSNGFNITIVHTQFNLPNPSCHPEFDFETIPDGLTDHEIASGNLALMISEINRNCKRPFQECLVRMVRQQESRDEITHVIYDELMFFAEAGANHLNLPSIVLRTVSAATFIARAAVLQLKTEGYIPLKDSNLLDPVPQLHSLRFKDLPISKFGIQENFLQLIAHSCDIRTSSAIIWNTMDCLEQSFLAQLRGQCSVPIFTVGPVHKFAPASFSSLLNEDWSCITWLDKQTKNTVLYISLGSIASLDKIEVEEMARGLANTKQPFLWVVRPGSILGSEWIELLPLGLIETVGERGCIATWAPQKEVLAHPAVGGFWSHCGWNSTLESISEGVPMICRPSFGDQKVNARFVSHVWGIGLQLEDELEGEKIERAIRTLMTDEAGKEMRRKAKDLKEKVDLCIEKGGSSHSSLGKLVEFMSF